MVQPTFAKMLEVYAVFKKKLDKGNPPDDWSALLKALSQTELRPAP